MQLPGYPLQIYKNTQNELNIGRPDTFGQMGEIWELNLNSQPNFVLSKRRLTFWHLYSEDLSKTYMI